MVGLVSSMEKRGFIHSGEPEQSLGLENPSLGVSERSQLTLEGFSRYFPRDSLDFSGLVMRTVGDAAAVPDPTGPFLVSS